MRPRFRLARVLVVLGVLALVFVVGAGVLLRSAWTRDRLRSLIVSKTAHLIDGQLRIGRLSGSLLSDVALDDVTIERGGRIVLSVPHVDARYRIEDMFSGTIVLERVSVTQPSVSIAQSTDGWHVVGLASRPSSTSSGHVRFRIERLQVAGGAVTIAPLGAPAHALTPLAVDGALSVDSHGVTLGILSAAARDTATGVTMRHFAGDVEIGTDLAVRRFSLETTASRLAGSVTIHALRHPTDLDVEVTGTPLAFPELAHYFTWAEDLPALDQVHATTHGPPARLVFDVAVADARAGRAHVRGTARLSPLHLDGSVEFEHANVAIYTSRAVLASDAIGQSAFTLDLPRADANALAITFDAVLSDATFYGYSGQRIAARGGYRNGVLTFAGHALAYGAVATDLSGSWKVETGALSLHARFAGVDLSRLPTRLGAPAWETKLAGQGDLTWAPGHLQARTNLDSSSMIGATLAPGTTAAITLDGDTFTYRAHVVTPDADLGRLAAAVAKGNSRVGDVAGHINAEVSVAGAGPIHDWRAHRAHATVTLTSSEVGPIRVSKLVGTIDLEGRRLTTSMDAGLAGPLDSWIRVANRPTVVDGHVNGDVVIADLTRPADLSGLGGHVTLALAPSTIAGVAIDSAGADAAIAGGVATIGTLDVRGPAVVVNASGAVALDRSAPASSLTYRIDVADLSKLIGSVVPGISGEASMSGNVSGAFDNLAATGTLRATRIAYRTFHALSLEATLGAAFPDFATATLRGSANASATFVTIGQSPIDKIAVTAAYDTAGLDVDVTAQQATRHAELAGLIVFAGGGEGIRLKRLAVGSGRLTWAMPAGTTGRVSFAGDTVTVSGLELRNGEQAISLQGAWQIRGAGAKADQSLSFRATNVELADLVPIALGNQDLAGLINADATLGGNAADPTVSLDGRLTGGEINKVPIQSVSARVSYRDHRATVDAALDAGSGSRLTATGTVALAGAASGAGLNVRVQGALANVAVLGPATTLVSQPRGAADLDLQLSGTLNAPRLSGHVALEDVGFLVVGTGVAYRHLTTTLRFTDRQMAIDAFSLEDDDGHRLTMSGTVDVFAAAGGARAVNLTANASAMHVLNNDLGEVALDAQVTVKGDTRAPAVTGSIRVERGRLEVDELLDRFTTTGYVSASSPTSSPSATSQPTPAAQPSGNPSTAAPAGAIRLTITLPDNLVARGHDLHIGQQGFGLGDINVTLGGHLTVTLVPGQAPLLAGRLDVVRGTYTFESRRFDLQRDGSIEFQGAPGPIDPGLDLTATRDITGVTATVTVGGTLRKPKLTLSSDPPLDQGDVLSLIIFNRAINDLGNSEQASLAASAGVMAASAIASPIATSVGRALDLDVFEVQSSDASGAGPTLTVGRQVSDRLFVGFKQEFGTGDVSLLTFEYRLSRFLRVVSSFAQGSTDAQLQEQAEAAGIDLFFVIRK